MKNVVWNIQSENHDNDLQALIGLASYELWY